MLRRKRRRYPFSITPGLPGGLYASNLPIRHANFSQYFRIRTAKNYRHSGAIYSILPRRLLQSTRLNNVQLTRAFFSIAPSYSTTHSFLYYLQHSPHNAIPRGCLSTWRNRTLLLVRSMTLIPSQPSVKLFPPVRYAVLSSSLSTICSCSACNGRCVSRPS